jgi:diamine N-acetyltransferase
MTDPELPIVNLSGELVALGPVSREMLPAFQRWINAFDVQARIGMPFPGPMTVEDQERWFDSVSADTTSRTFAVHDLALGHVVGTASVQGIDWRNGTGAFGIMIGDPAARGRGLGTETTRLVLHYAFTVLGLRAMSLSVAEFNVAGIRAYARAGYREAGRLRRHWLFEGRYWDRIYMDCLADEFDQPELKGQLTPVEAATGYADSDSAE